MSTLRLVIGNYNTSSRSLAVWMVLRRAGLAFDLEPLDLRDAEGLERARRLSPRGRLPVLEVGETIIWEPLAICEHAAEQCRELWPEAVEQRAQARAIAAEAVYELTDLLTFLPMDMSGRFSPPGKLLRGVQRDLDRLQELWVGCLASKPEGGPFLFGRFSVADAFMAPLVARLVTHGIEPDGRAKAYVRAIREMPEYAEWAAMAEAETVGTIRVTSGHGPQRRPGSIAAPRPASAPKRQPAGAPVEEVQPPPRPAPATGKARLFTRPASAATGKVPTPEPAGSATGPRAPAGSAEPTTPPSSREASPHSETGTAADPVQPIVPPTAAEADTPSPPRQRRRPPPCGPIVKPIGGGIRRRR